MGRKLGRLIGAALLAAAVTAPLAQPYQAPPSSTPKLTIKSLGAGTTRFDAERALGKIRCESDRNNSRLMSCLSEPTTYAGFAARVGFILADQQMLKVEVLGLRSTDFDRIAAALVAANGEPSERSTETLQNRMGAKFVGDTLVWMDADGTRLIARELGDSLDDARVYLLVPDAEAISSAITDNAAKKAAEDL